MASPFTPPTIPGAAGYPLGLAGATAATRYVGATAAGAPASGTFLLGDFVIDQTGLMYICTVAGSPGTWTQVGGSTVVTQLYDNTLSGSAATIDTGANGIAQTANHLLVEMYLRTDTAVTVDNLNVTVNNDSGANYDLAYVRVVNTGVTGQEQLGQTAWQLHVFGASATASAFTAWTLHLQAYRQTTGHKSVSFFGGEADAAAADGRSFAGGGRYRQTTAISRLALACGGNFVAGSRLTIYGLT